MNWKSKKVSNTLFYFSLALLVYMPLHVFIVQSVSLITGGLEMWKAAKDVIVVTLVPLLVFIAYRQKLFTGKYKWHFLLGSAYILLHFLFVVFDQNDDTYSAIVGSVYNSRLLAYLFLGVVVGSFKLGSKYLKWLLTATVLIASAVAVFGVLQYFLPSDLLTHVGYSLERGVKPLFFIDDKPDLPRVMSTLKDPNSFGAYLILPILLTGSALFNKKVQKNLFVRKFTNLQLSVMLASQLLALFFTFSRGAAAGLGLSAVTLFVLNYKTELVKIIKNYWIILAIFVFLVSSFILIFRDTYIVQNVIFHADESTVLEDPNELRVSLTQDAIDEILEDPTGYGPGTAGLVSISNPKGGILTENYYLQIAYEVGWLGLVLFIGILWIVASKLYTLSKNNYIASILLSSLVGYLFYSLLIHLWSNEAVAFQWWLLSGVVLGISLTPKNKNSDKTS